MTVGDEWPRRAFSNSAVSPNLKETTGGGLQPEVGNEAGSYPSLRQGFFLTIVGLTRRVTRLVGFDGLLEGGESVKRVLATGFEPVTPRSTIWCSNQLSYASDETLL